MQQHRGQNVQNKSLVVEMLKTVAPGNFGSLMLLPGSGFLQYDV